MEKFILTIFSILLFCGSYASKVYTSQDFINDYVVIYPTPCTNDSTKRSMWKMPPKSLFSVQNIDSLYLLAGLPFSTEWYPREAFTIRNNILLLVENEYLSESNVYHDGMLFFFPQQGDFIFSKNLGHLYIEHDDNNMKEIIADTLGSMFYVSDTIVQWIMEITSPMTNYKNVNYYIK